jgi:glucokinase
MKQQHPSIAETVGIEFSRLESKHILTAAHNGDLLSLKTAHKFLQILAAELQNLGHQFLPTGGIYLLGGVVNGLGLLIESKEFLDELQSYPLFVVNPEVEVGLRGALERAKRQ